MQGSIAFDGTLSGSIAGGGGGGSEVTITPVLTEGEKIADYKIDGTSGELYAPTPEALTAAAPLYITSGVISIDLSGYQEKLTAGSYISIDSDNEISCNPPITTVWYTPEPDVQQDVLIGKFQVNDVIQNVYAPNPSWDYSTSEVDTGQKWIDGKKIYCRVFEFTPQISIAYNSWTSLGIDASNFNTIIKAMCIDQNGTCWTSIGSAISSNTVSVYGTRSGGFSCSKYVCFYTKSI